MVGEAKFKCCQLPGKAICLGRPIAWEGHLPGKATMCLGRPSAWEGQLPGKANCLGRPTAWEGQLPGKANCLGRLTACEGQLLGKLTSCLVRCFGLGKATGLGSLARGAGRGRAVSRQVQQSSFGFGGPSSNGQGSQKVAISILCLTLAWCFLLAFLKICLITFNVAAFSDQAGTSFSPLGSI